MCKLWSATVLIFAAADPALALVVQLSTSIGGNPPQIDYPVGTPQPELTLQLMNETAVDTAPIGLWQLALSFVGDMSSNGEVRFSSIAVPVDPLFGIYSEPGPPIETPQSNLFVTDADVTFEGVSIPSGVARNILQLGVTVSSNAEGFFTLSMSQCDFEMPDQSSCWLPASGGSEPSPFDNSPDQMDDQRSILATILVSQPGVYGDYNGNRVVDAADYTVWRDHLGQLIALDNENPNAITPDEVDLEDYEFWSMHFGELAGSGSVVSTHDISAVPEPTTWILSVFLAVLGVVVWPSREHSCQPMAV